MDFTEVNYWAVLLATVSTMLLGFLWYSPVLLGNAWMKQRGLKKEDISGGGSATYILTALTALGGSFLLALLLTLGDGATMGGGLLVGLLVGISIALKIGMNYLFEGQKLGLYFITIGYHIVSYAAAGLIIGCMQ
ncbi:DUF1761 domain-containing protein [Paenibacillus sp. N4]|uniref:DUF1761 domain-containing protein n=1 Tax=Paenibacillus vietnamensis TaxID=2590547 RepID=UPI001CD05EA1|nr:DUF1761 domain-containing protein [Paenibacillus vietnamensis]MCA0756538.1 DUF1761 domain-containing protein [Paenibacillus vietnamensis]